MFLRVTEDEYWQIAHLAATMRMPRAQLVRLMLGDVLRRHGGRGPTFQIPEITA